MTNAVDLWVAWIRGWVAATNSLLEAQQQAMQRMLQMPRQTGEPALREMESATRQIAPAIQSLARMPAEQMDEAAAQHRGRGSEGRGGRSRAHGAGTAEGPDTARASEEVLRAAGNKPTSVRGRQARRTGAAASAAKRKRGRPRKQR